MSVDFLDEKSLEPFMSQMNDAVRCEADDCNDTFKQPKLSLLRADRFTTAEKEKRGCCFMALQQLKVIRAPEVVENKYYVNKKRRDVGNVSDKSGMLAPEIN